MRWSTLYRRRDYKRQRTASASTFVPASYRPLFSGCHTILHRPPEEYIFFIALFAFLRVPSNAAAAGNIIIILIVCVCVYIYKEKSTVILLLSDTQNTITTLYYIQVGK